MALSLHAERLFQGEEDVQDFAGAWSLAPARRRGEQIPRYAIDPKLTDYFAACQLGHQVDATLNLIDRSKIHFVIFEEMRDKPRRTYSDILSFLGLEQRIEVDLPVVNRRKARRSQGVQKAVLRLGRLKRRLGVRRGFGALRTVERLNTLAGGGGRDAAHEGGGGRAGSNSIAGPSGALVREMKAAFRDDVALLSELVKRDLGHWTADA